MKMRIQEFQQEQTLISLSRREIAPESINGYVIDHSEDLVEIAEFNDLGEYDGVTIVWLYNISEIVWNSVELHSLNSLIQQQPKERKKISYPEQLIPEFELESMENLIRSISRGFRSLAVYKESIGSGGHFGQLASIDEDWIELLEFSPKDSMNRYNSLGRVEDITMVRVDSQYLRTLEALFLK